MRNMYTVDWQLYKQWIRESSFRGARLVFFIVWCVLLVVSLSFSVFSLANNLDDYFFFFLFIAVLSVYRAFFYNFLNARQQFKIAIHTYGTESWIRTISFDEDGFSLNDADKAESKFLYSDISEIIEKDDVIYIKLKTKTFIRLYKTKFVDCTWDECKALIQKNNSLL